MCASRRYKCLKWIKTIQTITNNYLIMNYIDLQIMSFSYILEYVYIRIFLEELLDYVCFEDK
jgi:hypothetical protein